MGGIKVFRVFSLYKLDWFDELFGRFCFIVEY